MANGGGVTEKVPAGELLVRAAATEGESIGDFDDVYRRCRPGLVLYAERRNARDPELVADLALLDIYRALDRLRSDHPRAVWAYLYRAIDNHMKRERMKLSPELRDDLEELGGSYTFEDDVIGHFNLDETLALLSTNQEMALRPRLEESLTAEEIGARIGKSANAVRQLQHKAIERLRYVLIVAAAVIVVLLAVVLGNEGSSVVDQSPATSSDEQVPVDTTVTTVPSPTASTETTVPGRATSDQAESQATAVGPTTDPTDGGEGAPDATAPTTSTAPSTTETPEVPIGVIPPASPPEGASGSFALVNAGSGRCVDQPWSQDDGGAVIQWRCAGHTASNQVLQATQADTGFTLAFTHSGRCLDERDGEFVQFTCHGGENQLFNWDGSQLRAVGSGLCLTVKDDSAENGAAIHAAPCIDSPAQRFRVERYGTQLPAS